MTITAYCWRCGIEVPMLDEQEWAEIEPLLRKRIDDIKDYRRSNECTLGQAAAAVDGKAGALQRYRELTGFEETNALAIWHHRRSDFGPPCTSCGKPLRTPRAKLCAACGTPVS
ncbi:zinc-ribbon domain-containing protein [Bradyrhizobium aeschynomenes]|uniref:zinc-ribbon domain-containing protein n=1 Tax=Bradyrhizobium aeschynomenes TaxID=2734909 RepID=UPI001AED7FE4|nr:zinc-ribbon domain-containing protein [Bradyrhizobium aeschynomenes]